MSGLEQFLWISAGIGGPIGTFFLIQKFKHWWRPIRITATLSSSYETPDTEQISATITNISREPQLVVKCNMLAAYPARVALRRHLKQPFMHPKFYRILWYGPVDFGLMSEDPIRLQPKEQKVLSRSVFLKRPMDRLLYVTDGIKAEVRLAGRRWAFRSKRTFVPKRSLHLTPKSKP